MTALHRSFTGIHEAWGQAYERVLAAVAKLDTYDTEELRDQDENIGAIPRYAA